MQVIGKILRRRNFNLKEKTIWSIYIYRLVLAAPPYAFEPCLQPRSQGVFRAFYRHFRKRKISWDRRCLVCTRHKSSNEIVQKLLFFCYLITFFRSDRQASGGSVESITASPTIIATWKNVYFTKEKYFSR